MKINSDSTIKIKHLEIEWLWACSFASLSKSQRPGKEGALRSLFLKHYPFSKTLLIMYVAQVFHLLDMPFSWKQNKWEAIERTNWCSWCLFPTELAFFQHPSVLNEECCYLIPQKILIVETLSTGRNSWRPSFLFFFFSTLSYPLSSFLPLLSLPSFF